MEFSLGKFAFDIILDLVKDVVERVIEAPVSDFFLKRRINQQVENSVAAIVEPLLPFLKQEKIPEDKQQRLLQTCVNELRSLSQHPKLLFQGSLNGQKLFDSLYSSNQIPQVIIEDGVKEVYILLFPRIAELLCKVPIAIKEWESLAWSENYRRLDEIIKDLQALFKRVDEIHRLPEYKADELLKNIRRFLLQSVEIEDITGLRNDKPYSGNLNDIFVHPEIQEIDDEIHADQPKKNLILSEKAASFDSFVESNERHIIIGPPGAGKSTWTKWFQRETLLSTKVGFGIRVELRKLNINSLPSIQKLIRDSVGIHFAEEITHEVISRWLDNRLVVFIFDGFDEIASNNRDIVYKWLGDLILASHGCPVLLTSRPLTTNHLIKNDIFSKKWRIEAFDLARIIDYIQRWYQYAPLLADSNRNIDAEKLAREWQEDPTIAPLTGNPLLLSTLLMVNHLDGHLPNGRSRLYQRYIEGMLGIWDDRRNLLTLSPSLTLEQKKQILQGLAFNMFINHYEQLEETEANIWMQDFLNEKGISQTAVEVLCLLCERSGLINGPGIYTFVHKSIAEYLVAEVVWEGNCRDQSGKRVDRMYLFEQRGDDSWNSVTFFWAGLASSTELESFINLCLEVDNFVLGYGILLDQFDHISDREIKRQWLVNANISKWDPFNEKFSRVIFSILGSPKHRLIRFEFGNPFLRGVVRDATFIQLIDKAIKTKIIIFDDRLIKQARLGDVIWLDFAQNLDIAISIKEYLENKYPGFNLEEDWAIYTLDNMLRKLILSPNDVSRTINDVFSSFPNHLGVIPLMVLSHINYISTYFGLLNNNKDLSNRINTALLLISKVDLQQIDSSLLLRTKQWEFIFGRKGPLDLLESSKEVVNELKDNGSIDSEEIYNSVNLFIDLLIEKRSVLEKLLEH